MASHKTKFAIYNLAGKEKSYYLAEKITVEIKPEAIPKKAIAHSIIIIDRSGSMYYDIEALKETLIKLLTLDEYSNSQLVVTLISYSSKGDVTCHFQRVSIQDVMANDSPYIAEIKAIKTGCLTCISQSLKLAQDLIKPGELTAITLHSDGYANDSSFNAESKTIEAICNDLQNMDVFVNTIAYSPYSDFKFLAKIANSVSGSCLQAGNIKEVYDALYNTGNILKEATGIVIEETLATDYSYQIFFSPTAKKINGTNQTLKVFGLKPEDQAYIYKYKQITQDAYSQLTDISIAQNDQSVYLFAKANLADGNLNTAKYALASTFNATLTERHSKALTNQDIASFSQDLDIAIFYPHVLAEYEILDHVKVNDKIAILDLIETLSKHSQHIIINLKYLQETYQRKGVKRVNGTRGENGELIKPWLEIEYIEPGDYVQMGSFDINRNTATINMLIQRNIKLVKSADKTPITEVAGVLLNDLRTFNNYTIVSDGEINVKALKVKISSKKAFDELNTVGVIDGEEFDFQKEYTLQLQGLPLLNFAENYQSIDGLFTQLAEIKVLSSILAAHLRSESDVFIPAQIDELKKHYLSTNLYLNFPTTNEYTDLKIALSDGTVDSRISYKIDIGSKEILNLSKLSSANQFLDKRYEVYDAVTGEIFTKPTFELGLNQNIAFRAKSVSARTKITKADDLMKVVFNDFLELENNGKVAEILNLVGAGSLAVLLQAKHAGTFINKQEIINAMTTAKNQLQEYTETVYREKISPLVFYIGATGLLPDEMNAQAMTADELGSKYTDLQFSKSEQEGTFFVFGDTVISVYAQTEYFSKMLVSAS
ncbi:VWA domain-containing protein [Anabaena sp. FACHB-1237]|uniref:vWA domain-containing protein n=1 Tax=Anabaena sp. FACHB-1237 TaxID=2692769 RepID=UPI0016800EC0|nr:vWA domain-containing protein [Anabaena sp. FACHB-1237]MBD2136559.1 VWA domain-containing protein [Anabaena sp. FACHB-1237]